MRLKTNQRLLLLSAASVVFLLPALPANASLIDLQLRAVATGTPTDTVTILPDNVIDVPVGESFFLEVWMKDVGANKVGISGAYFELAYDTALFDATALGHGGNYAIFRDGSIDDANGLIDLFGASSLGGAGTLAVDSWEKLGTVTLQRIAPGEGTFTPQEETDDEFSRFTAGAVPWNEINAPPLTLPTLIVVDDTYWTAAVDDWFDPGNWSSGEPGSTDTGYINNAGTAQIAEGCAEAHSLFVGFDGNPGAVQLSGTGELSALFESIGDSGTGTFTQTGGTNTVNDELYLGYHSGADGTYEFSGGSLSAETISVAVNGTGQFNWTGGTLAVDTVNVGGNGTWTATQDWSSHGQLDLDGGSVVFGAGRLALIETGTITGHGMVEATVWGGNLSTISANGGTLEIGNANSFAGFQTDGTVVVEGATDELVLHCKGFVSLGRLTTIGGGTLEATNGIALGIGGTLTGSGTVNAKVAAGFGSMIVATGALSVGDADAYDGFASDGVLHVNDHTVTIRDKNEAVLGSLTTLGSGESPGTLEAANGLLVEFGKNVTGYGTIDTPNNSATPLIVNGFVGGNSGEEPITLNGYIKGVGTLEHVVIAGTISPGFSPAEVDLIDAVLAETATLIMELGGTSPGSAYDVLNVSERIGLAGMLDVDLINGYRPREGDAFDLFNFADFSGEFDAISLPALRPGLAWDQSQLYRTGTLAVVPEPSTFVVGALALLGLLACGCRRRRTA